MIVKIILGLWIAAVVLDAVGLISLFVKKIVRQNIPLAVFLAGSFSKSVVLMAAMYMGGFEGYKTAWFRLQPLSFPLHMIQILGAFHGVARCFKGIYPFAFALMAVVGGFAGLGAWASVRLTPEEPGILSAAIYMARHDEAFGMVFIGLTMLFFWQWKGLAEACPNGENNAAITMAYFGVAFLFGTLYASGWLNVGQIGLQAGTVLCYAGWAFLMTRDGEMPPPGQRVSEEELAAQERRRRALERNGIPIISVRR